MTHIKNYAELAEQNCQEELLVALGYLVNISEVEEVEVFKGMTHHYYDVIITQ